MPNFELWSHENLASFAAEAYVKMQEQQERIEQLQNELKDAIKAYRELNK
jgi:outer membrane protein TolC